MSLVARVRSWLYSSLHRAELERSMHDELQFHIERYADDLTSRQRFPLHDGSGRKIGRSADQVANKSGESAGTG
jgi:hypothetical protein